MKNTKTHKWCFDTPLDKAIEGAEKRLKQLQIKDPEAVFHCPACGKNFELLGNYDELKMCGKCFSKKSTEEMQEHTLDLINGTITNVKVGQGDPFHPSKGTIGITEITVKTTKGKIMKVKKPKEAIFIL